MSWFGGIGLGIAIAISTMMVFAEHSNAYKQGQIDALTGKVKVELKVKEDGSSEWGWK
jgi:hypothetical protein